MKKILSFCLCFLLAASLCLTPALGCYSEAAEKDSCSALKDSILDDNVLNDSILENRVFDDL